MSTSFSISEQYNFQSLLWDAAGATYRAWLPTIWAVLHVLALTLGLTAALVGAVVLVATIQPIVWLALAVIALFAYATYPKAVK